MMQKFRYGVMATYNAITLIHNWIIEIYNAMNNFGIAHFSLFVIDA